MAFVNETKGSDMANLTHFRKVTMGASAFRKFGAYGRDADLCRGDHPTVDGGRVDLFEELVDLSVLYPPGNDDEVAFGVNVNQVRAVADVGKGRAGTAGRTCGPC